MQCTKCGTENPDSLKFCGECGTPTGVPCPYCKHRNPKDAKVCTACERALGSGPMPTAERRQLTVFFVDLVGSASLSEAFDPEELRDLYAEYQGVCAAAIERYEGHVAQYLGDGILAYFGYPKAHEDDAVRAVQAGLDTLQALSAMSLRGGEPPQVRIGIHTGLVVVGDVGSGNTREQLALGEAPNVASRLQGEAEPDTIMISDATRRLVAGHFALEDLGTRKLKGISREMQLFRVSGRSEASSRFGAMAASGLAPFIGREREVEAIRSAWAEASAGAGQTLLLRGEAGIGKSRLLGIAMQTALGQVHESFEVECSPYDMNSALHPITQALDRKLGFTADMSPDRKLDRLENGIQGRGVAVDEALPLLAALFSIPTGDRYPAIALPPARQRQRTLEILADLVLHAPAGAPVLLLVEDLHWADPSTLELVASLVARQATQPLLMVCTTRPVGSVSWPPAAHWREIQVVALDQSDARNLIAGVVGRKTLPEEVVQQLIERTGGVPLFVEAVTRTIIETGVLRELDDRYELTGPLPPGLIPATVHDSLMARIDRLGPDKAVAQLASAIGREFGFALLLSVSDKTLNGLEHALNRLVELDLVSQSGVAPTSTYTFKHALIQDAAYESLLRKTRQEYHETIAKSLVANFPDVAAKRPELVAQHFSRAGLGAQAIGYWLSAGQQALGRAANHEAIAHLKRGLELINDVPEAERLAMELEFQAALAPALTATQGWASPELDRAYRRAGELVDLVAGTPHRLPVLWGTWAYHFVAGRVGESLALAPQVLTLATSVGNPLLIPPARHATACSHCYHGDFHASIEHANAGLAVFDLDQERLIARNFGHGSSVCLLSFKGDALWMLGFPDQALAASDESLALARQLNHMPSLAWAVSYKTWFHHLLRDPVHINEMADEAVRLSNEEGFAFWEPMVAVYRGWAMAQQGHVDEGIAHMRNGLARYRAAGNGCTQVHMLAALAEVLWDARQVDEAFTVLREGMALAKGTEEGFYEPEFYRLKGKFLFDQATGLAEPSKSGGDRATLLASAQSNVRLALEMSRMQEAKSLELRALMTLCDVQRELGDSTQVRQALADVLSSFTEGLDTPDLVDARAMLEQVAV
ncbi:MAG: adenylate/guanylate cyclase domain-containing protein [Gemmatimonadaceae bacterium]